MNLFAVIMLVVLLIISTNLINWMWRSDISSEIIILVFFATILYLLGIYFAIKYIIIWGITLI